MFANITASVAQIFSAVTTLASAADRAAKTLDNLAQVGEQTSAQYVDNAKIDREIKQIERMAEYEQAKAKAMAKAKSLALANASAVVDVEAK